MAYQQIYNLEFLNHQGQTCLLELWKDTTDPPVEIAYLTGSDRPVTVKAIDNDRKLHTPIRGKELVAEIVTNTLSITTFQADEDTTWKGIFKVDGVSVFSGFLVQEDSVEEFVSYNHVLSLTFTDGLGLLKGVEFRQSNGSYWFANITLLEAIKACLNRTGQTLDLRVLCNLFPSSVSDVTVEAFISINKVNTRTFQKNKRDFIDCYEVLTEIMRSCGCTLYQYGGEWVMDRWIDRHEQVTREFTYDLNNDVTYVGSTYTELAIGEAEDIKEVEQPLQYSVLRAAKENKLTYRFETWPELIRNMDFDEGTADLILSGATQRTYSLDYFTLTGRTAYSRREIDTLGNETQRYMYIDGAADWSDYNKYVQSLSFPALKGDKLTFGYSCSTETDVSSTQPARAKVSVKCGSYYLLTNGKWKQLGFTVNPFVEVEFEAAENSTEWKSVSVESDEIPADGEVEVYFFLIERCGAGNESRYKDIDIKYMQNIKNAYSAEGDINLYQNTVGKNPVNETVRVSDALKKILKGALLQNDGDLEVSWKRGGVTETKRYTQLNAFGYYQSTYRGKARFEGTFMGGLGTVGFKPQYTIADAPNKKFALASFDSADYLRGIWRGTLIEVHDTVVDADISTLDPDYVYNFVFI